jgi:hypothetical protein
MVTTEAPNGNSLTIRSSTCSIYGVASPTKSDPQGILFLSSSWGMIVVPMATPTDFVTPLYRSGFHMTYTGFIKVFYVEAQGENEGSPPCEQTVAASSEGATSNRSALQGHAIRRQHAVVVRPSYSF